MAGFQLTRTIGEVSATYKFTAKYNLKAGQKVTVHKHLYTLLPLNTVSLNKNQHMYYKKTAVWFSFVSLFCVLSILSDLGI